MTPSQPTAALKPIDGLVGPKDLTVETYREYVFLPGGETYRVDNPVALYYREGGTTHRVVDAAGVVHCVPYGIGQCVVLRWKNRDANDPVTF